MCMKELAGNKCSAQPSRGMLADRKVVAALAMMVLATQVHTPLGCCCNRNRSA